MKIPFDIKYKPQIESGEYKVETFSGYPVTIYRWDFDDGEQTPIMGSYVFEDGKEYVRAWNDEGHFDLMSPNDLDLLIVTPEEELTEFEKKLSDVVGYAISLSVAEPQKSTSEFVKEYAAELLALAREQFIKNGYVIEKKAFHDAVEKVAPEVMKEVSDKVDKANEELTEFEKAIKDLVLAIDEGELQELGVFEEKNLGAWAVKKAAELIELVKKECKAEVLKDLPRWGSNLKSSMVDEADVIGQWLYYKEHRIRISDLEKLPGFNE